MDFVEKLLQEAADRGEFDAGEAAGTSIHLDDSSPGWWGRREARRIQREEEAGRTLTSVERMLGGIWTLPSERAVRARVDDLNRLLVDAGVDGAHLDEDATVDTWKRMVRLRLLSGRGRT